MSKLHIIIEPEYKDSVCGADWLRGEDRDLILKHIREGYKIDKNICLNCLNKLGVPYTRR